MRFSYVVVLVATALVGCTAASTASKATGIARDSPRAIPSNANNDNVASGAKRMLRTNGASDMENEERTLAHLFSSVGVVDTVKLKRWLGKEKSTTDALVALKLNKGVDHALAHSDLKVLSKYVDMLNNKHEDGYVSLLGTLTAHYGDEAVAKALVSAKRADGTSDIATALQKQQLDAWLYNGKDADDVFGILGIGAEGSRSMNSRKLVVLNEYINLFNARYPGAATDSYIVLRDGFGGEADFARVLSMAKLHPESKRMIANTSKYQGELFRKWRDEDKLEPMGVLSTVLEGGSFGTASSEDKLVTNHYNVFYKRWMREQ